MAGNRKIVVALGGNAILQPGQRGTYEQQAHNTEAAAARIADAVAQGFRVVVTHGNGPQVGNLLIQYAAAADLVEPMPMFVAGAQTEGQLGFMIEQSLLNHLSTRGLDTPVTAVLTEVEVDPEDPALRDPTKPVGPFYSGSQARELAEQRGWQLREDAGRGWRRVVASPRPKTIVNIAAVTRLLEAGHVVIACGGGGIPVVRDRDGRLRGVEAVIDKDLASARLAAQLHADTLVILTEVPYVYVDFGTPHPRPLRLVGVAELTALARQGHFADGSMGPKVRAAIDFVEAGGRAAVIARLDQLAEALSGRAGTRIVASPDRAGGAAGRRQPGPAGAGHRARRRTLLESAPAARP